MFLKLLEIPVDEASQIRLTYHVNELLRTTKITFLRFRRKGVLN